MNAIGARNKNRSGKFSPDPDVPHVSDNNGMYGDYTRGHLAPSKDMGWSAEARNASYYFSNIVPQAAAFNSGVWLALEKKVREWAKTAPLHVVTGPVYRTAEIDRPRLRDKLLDVPPQRFQLFMLTAKESRCLPIITTAGLRTDRRIPKLAPRGTLPVPQGFFKIIYKKGAPTRIFLFPHTLLGISNTETGLSFKDFELTSDDRFKILERYTGFTFNIKG